MTSVAFQSILRKQIRKLPKILKSVKIIQYYSILFIRVLRGGDRLVHDGRPAGLRVRPLLEREERLQHVHAPRVRELAVLAEEVGAAPEGLQGGRRAMLGMLVVDLRVARPPET